MKLFPYLKPPARTAAKGEAPPSKAGLRRRTESRRGGILPLSEGAKGFTLIEILIAIFIFSIVVTTIFGSYNFVFSTIDDVDGILTINETARSCLNRMVFDLEAAHIALPPAYRPPEFNSAPDPYRFTAEIETVGNSAYPKLRFFSFAHLALEKSQQEGIAEIIYYVQPAAKGSFVLRRSDSTYPYEPFRAKATDPVLCENLKLLKLTCYDQDGVEHDNWDSESEAFRFATPRAVGIEIELGTDSLSQRFATMVALPVYRLKAK